jgi:MFS family permease
VKYIRLLLGINIFWLSLSILSDGFNSLLLPYFLLGVGDENYKASLLGLLTFVGLLFGMLLQPVAGMMSDRLRSYGGRRGIILVGLLILLVSMLLFGRSRAVWLILASYLLLQGGTNIAQAGQQGFIPDLVPENLRGTAAGIKGFMDVGGAFLGFAILGQLLSQGQSNTALLIIAIFAILTFMMTIVLVKEPKYVLLPSVRRLTLFEIFRLNLKQHRIFAWLVVSRFLFLFGTYIVGRFLLYFVTDRLHFDANQATEATGNLLAVLTLVTAISALVAGWAADRLGRLPLMVVGCVLSSIGVLLLIIADSLLKILLFGGLMAFGSAAFAGSNWAMTADYVPSEEAGRFMALANFGTAGAAATVGLLGPLVDGINHITADSGYSALFIVATLAFVGSALVLRKVTTSQELIAVVHQ